MRDQNRALAAVPWEGPGTHCTGGWVDIRASLDSMENLTLAGI